MLAGLLALIVASLFTGAAFYISFAEQPARLGLDDRTMLAEWKPAYQRGFVMQASLAVIGFGLGLIAWWQTGEVEFLIGGLALVANWPFTLFFIKPVNDALMATPPEQAGPATRRLMGQWAALHACRTGLGALSIVILLAALAGPWLET